MLYIRISPQRSDAAIPVEIDGTNLIIDGDVVDLTAIAEPDEEGNFPLVHPRIAGQIEHDGDDHTVTLIWSYVGEPTWDVMDPPVIAGPPDGPLVLPS